MESLPHLPPSELALLGFALFLVLFFEFINGFHDTANAVATVIYTHTLKPTTAVPGAGLWNFLGVLLSGSAVAFGIVKLLPADLVAGAHPGLSLAMLLAVMLAAILWNFGTWYFGLPASSSHTLIGSILGASLMYSWRAGHFGEGLNWHKAADTGVALLISPAIGFALTALLLLFARIFIKNPAFHKPAEKDRKPPPWIRALLLLTCTGVSFAHGSNDGQKGLGLLMLALIIILPAQHSFDPAGIEIPLWAKLTVAIALGCGTMIGWKRIVVTVGEKIGKTHMSYAQGAAAEVVAMGTIQAASTLGLPVSTTHVLSSGIAGAMFASQAGLQAKTVRNILLAWIFTLPASVLLGSASMAGGIFLLLPLLGVHFQP